MSGKKREFGAMMDEGGEFKVPSLVNTAGGAKKRSSATTGDLLSDAEARKAASGEVKRLLAQLERAFLDNSEQRLAFADDASRFLPSELALDDAVKQCEAESNSRFRIANFQIACLVSALDWN
jgi:hypothetical protein